MKIADALLGEHGVLYALMDQIEAVAAAATSVNQVQEAGEFLSGLLLSHATLEDDLLFPALESQVGPGGPLEVLRAEHTEIETALRQLDEAKDLVDGVGRVAYLLGIVRDHFEKEEEVLFPMARDALDDETQLRLGKAWAEARRVTIA